MDSTSATNASAPTVTLESAIDLGKRAFALRRYEQAVEHYTTALELMTATHGEDAPETADLYFVYGKALLENAIAQNSVLGQNQPEEQAETNDTSACGSRNGPILSFTGDADDTEDQAVDLFSEASKAVAEAEAAAAIGNDDDEEEDEDAEPEDDFNAAWEVLDVARSIYEKQQEAGVDDAVQLKLAETYVALGDVSLETEKFDQAITDYETSLGLKLQLLPTSSRQIAEAHYKLSIVLDMTPGRLSDSILHAEKALESIETRLSELRDALPSSSATPQDAEQPDPKGKGKAKQIAGDDAISKMTTGQIEGELKELEELKEDLVLKIEELKTSPNENTTQSAPALAAAALDKELNGGTVAVPNQQPVVNDLTGMIKKKKKPVPEMSSPSKRKAEEDAGGSEKKPKVDES